MVVPERERLRAAELAEVESVRLFVERGREVNARWRFNDESAPHVARICRTLDGHPLALELAAARVKVLSPEKIADRLDAGIELLKAGSRDAHPDRQKTLAAAWGWSWEALAEPAQRLFERLSVFRGGFSLDAIETVCSDDDLVPKEDVVDLLAELIDHGLVIYAGEARYRLLEPVRQFAARKLAERGQSEAMVQRHTQYFMQLVGNIALKMSTDEGFSLLAQAKGDMDNMRHAAAAVDEVTDPVTALMFHIPFGLLLWVNQLEQEGDERLSRAIAAAPDVPPELHAAALLVMAYLRLGAADRQSAADAVAAARQAWDAIGDPARRAECCELAAIHALIENDLPGAERAAREGLGIGEPSGYNTPLLHTWLSWSLRQQDKFEEAEAAAAAAANEIAGSDDPYRLAWTIGARAGLEEDQGDWEAVERCFEEQMDIINRHGIPGVVGRGGITEHNAMIRAIRGRIDEALALARIANEIFSTRDNRGLRMFFPALHRGDPKPGDTEKSLQRHYQRLKLPPLEGAADALIERLEQLESRLNRLGRTDKADDCRRAIAALQAAVGLSDSNKTSD
jgi:tetratricopeptide (TPR) repeat protein